MCSPTVHLVSFGPNNELTMAKYGSLRLSHVGTFFLGYLIVILETLALQLRVQCLHCPPLVPCNLEQAVVELHESIYIYKGGYSTLKVGGGGGGGGG